MVNNIYVRTDNREFLNLMGKYQRKFYEIFPKIRIEKVKNGTIIIIPSNYRNNKYRIKKQIKKYIESKENENIIYSYEIDEDMKWNNGLTNVNGKKIMKKVLIEILNFIYNTVNANMELDDVHIFISEYNKANLYIIQELVEIFRTVNIITSNITKFRILENKYERNNVLITVSNNKRKSARNAHIIINLDFDNSNLEKYIINNNAIIINLNNEKIVLRNNFNGIIINDYNIKVDNDFETYIKEFYGNINPKFFIDGNIENNLVNNSEKVNVNNRLKIKELIGIRGVISCKEFVQNYKIFKKCI